MLIVIGAELWFIVREMRKISWKTSRNWTNSRGQDELPQVHEVFDRFSSFRSGGSSRRRRSNRWIFLVSFRNSREKIAIITCLVVFFNPLPPPPLLSLYTRKVSPLSSTAPSAARFFSFFAHPHSAVPIISFFFTFFFLFLLFFEPLHCETRFFSFFPHFSRFSRNWTRKREKKFSKPQKSSRFRVSRNIFLGRKFKKMGFFFEFLEPQYRLPEIPVCLCGRMSALHPHRVNACTYTHTRSFSRFIREKSFIRGSSLLYDAGVFFQPFFFNQPRLIVLDT